MAKTDRWRTFVAVLPLALTFLFSATAYATIMVEVPLEELIRDADAIVYGTVVRNDVRMVAGENSLEPQTITTVRVREWLAGADVDGSRGATVAIRELGGRWRDGETLVAGSARYRMGEEVVVFLRRRPEAPHDLRTMAMAQGKFVVRHAVGGSPMIERDLEGVAFARWSEGRQVVASPGVQPRMPLDAFLGYIRQMRGAPMSVVDAEGAVRSAPARVGGVR